MKLSRKWLSEFVCVDANDREFAEAMTLSGSKVEGTEDLGAEISNVVVGRIEKMERHPDSDHMWVCQLDVGKDEPVQIVTGAWNIHEGDMVPVALHKSTLPGGKKIEKGKLRGILSNGMLCSLSELGLDERDFPYGVVTAAALLNDYKPIDPEKPSVPLGVTPGYRIFGSVKAAFVTRVENAGDGSFVVNCDSGGIYHTITTTLANIHEHDTLALDTEKEHICTLADLHAEQREFPHCINDGIFVLHEDCQPGDDIKPVINADDHVVEFEITPNRPDCLSVIGLAREVSATFDKPCRFHQPVVKGGGEGVLTELLDVETPDPELCPRYTARMVRNVKIAPSPKWMRERLRSMGVRPINNIVDITNYVMLEYGQPMHAFDYRYVKGGKIVVRRAAEGEELTTLDGNVRKLTGNMLVIADETRAVGLAGIMGGENSEIVADTADVVFESANFDGTCIRKAALALGMRTEASAKFEKGLDILNTLPAVNRACELVELLGAGEVLDGVIDVLNYVPQPTVLKVEPEKINALLGTNVAENVMYTYLQRLGFETTAERGMIQVPSWRGDVKEMADLAEEVARFYGYNNIPCTLMRGQTTLGGYTPAQQADLRLQRDHHLLLHLPHGLRQDRLGPQRAHAQIHAHPQPPGGGHLHHAHHGPALHAGGAGPQLQQPQPVRPALRTGEGLSPRREGRSGGGAQVPHPGRLRGGYGLFHHEGRGGGPAWGAADRGCGLLPLHRRPLLPPGPLRRHPGRGAAHRRHRADPPRCGGELRRGGGDLLRGAEL